MYFISDHGVTPTASGVLQKANLLLLSKEATEKDRSLKTQFLLSTNSQSSEKINGEAVWKKLGFFSDERTDFNFEKRNFLENTLCYINQGNISTVKEDELDIYTYLFLLRQLTVAANQPADIKTCESKKSETKPISSLYNQETGEFLGLAK